MDYMKYMNEGDELTCWDSVIDSEFYLYKTDYDKPDDYPYINMLEKYLTENLEIKETGEQGITVGLYDLLDNKDVSNIKV